MATGRERERERRWESQPVGAAFVRLAVFAVPVVASVTVAALLGRLMSPAPDVPGLVLRVAAVLLPATLTLWLVDRVARRFLPLATLLRLSLLFPDRAPSRYAVARLVNSTRELQRRVDAARQGLIPREPGEAAETILALVSAVSTHDRRTRGHSERVRIYADLLAEEIGLPTGDRDRLRWAALVHDTGKLAVPERILNKAGRPSDDEWTLLRRHPEEGARLCAPLLPWLGEAGRGIVEHHERFDGGGYPAGLAGYEISLGGRILAVADAFEVMTAARAYKRAMSAAAAREELARCAGGQFDPAIVRAFLSISLGRLRLAMGPLSWLAQWPFLSHLPQFGQSAGQAGAAFGGAAALGAAGLLATPAASTPAEARPPAVAQPASDLDAADGDAGGGDVADRDTADRDVADPAVGGRDGSERHEGSASTPSPTPVPAPQPRVSRTSATEAPARPTVEAGPPAQAPEPVPASEPPGEPAPARTEEPAGPDGDGGSPTEDLVDGAVDAVTDLVDDVVDTVEDAVDSAGDLADDLIDGLPEPLADPLGDVVDGADGALEDVVTGAGDAIGEAVDGGLNPLGGGLLR